MEGYSKKVVVLTDLLKKDQKWFGSPDCQMTFDKLKRAISNEPVLKLSEFDKPFKVERDAFDRTPLAVLVQEGRPVAFESWKLNETEQRFTVHEKEMTAVVHCLRLWRHYLLGGKFEIQTDNVAMSYFDTQKKLRPKQARWQELLAEFDCTLKYKPGKINVVADTRSRFFFQCSPVEGDIFQQIRAETEKDVVTSRLLQVREGVTRRFWVEDGVLYAKDQRSYVSNSC